MNASENHKITLRSNTPVSGKFTLSTPHSTAHAHEFQAKLQQNRAARQGYQAEIKAENRPRIPSTPLEDQASTLLTDIINQADECVNLYSPNPDAQETVTTWPLLERSRLTDPNFTDAPFAGAENSLIMSLTQKLDFSTAASGQFDLLMPSGHEINVHYEVSPKITQVLLRAPNTGLSHQLKQCANSIGSALSKRSGRLVEVTAI